MNRAAHEIADQDRDDPDLEVSQRNDAVIDRGAGNGGPEPENCRARESSDARRVGDVDGLLLSAVRLPLRPR